MFHSQSTYRGRLIGLLRAQIVLAVVTALTVAALAAPTVAAAGAAATAGTGLAISPSIIEHAAATGAVGSVTVSNTTGETMKISVSARPWLQSASGAVRPATRRKLSGVILSPSSFTLPSGSSQQVSLGLTHAPAKGSLYGSVDVLGVPATTVHRGVVVDYRLIGTLRLDPATPVYGARTVAVRVNGTHHSGEVSVAVENTGNTVAPIGGAITLRGALGSATAKINPVRIVPGVTVELPSLHLHSTLPAGRYTLKATLVSGTAKSHSTAKITLR